MRLFTIGFTKKSAKQFFDLLRASGTRRIVDVRLNNVSQLAGFAKKQDLAYFAKTICDIDYVHMPEFAPTQTMLDGFKKRRGSWADYERSFIKLLRDRHVETATSMELLAEGCLLCSEEEPDQCHRRLVAEYLRDHWDDVQIVHLV